MYIPHHLGDARDGLLAFTNLLAIYYDSFSHYAYNRGTLFRYPLNYTISLPVKWRGAARLHTLVWNQIERAVAEAPPEQSGWRPPPI
jgi:hypothetical protein